MASRREIKDLIGIGLTDGEAKVYLALTEIGSSTVGPIVKKSGVAYSNVYDVLNRLIEKGIVSFVIKSKTKHFQAVSPGNLLDYLNKKEEEVRGQKESLKGMLPWLEDLQKMKSSPEAEVFVGFKGLKSAYEKILTGLGKNDEDLFFYVHEKNLGEDVDDFYFSLNYVFDNIKMRGISNEVYRDSPVAKAFFSDKTGKNKMRFVDFPIPGSLDIVNDQVLIVSWLKPVVGILIKSENIAKYYRDYFESIWKVAKK